MTTQLLTQTLANTTGTTWFHPSSLVSKLRFLAQHSDAFHVVSDFDGTLNYFRTQDAEQIQSLISLIYNNHILDESYMIQAQELYRKYILFETDISIDPQLRTQAMEARATEHKNLLIKFGLTKDHLHAIIDLNKIKLRKGVDSFIQTMNLHSIPFIIFSASEIGMDAIPLVFEHAGMKDLDYDIVSNGLIRDTQGKMIGSTQPAIHPLNKTESIISQSPSFENIYQSLESRPHAIVIGDNVHDADMVDHREDRVTIRIGFCNYGGPQRMEEFQQHFDIVITGDKSFTIINQLLLEHTALVSVSNNSSQTPDQ